ncbi:cell division protein ZipA [Bowmanella denitrificans]|uniref:Cell division protein ZipA n=1 Tax=Bowmanella denitrificans TaxID=366582 RepID=A0ABN0XCR2_9ALTE
MEELRLTFLIFGALAIAGILVHGLWTVRKKNSKKRQSKPAYLNHRQQQAQDQVDEDDSDFAPQKRNEPQFNDFDELGLGPVRVVKNQSKKADEPPLSADSSETHIEPTVCEPQGKSPEKREEQRDVSAVVPEPPASLLRKDMPPESAQSSQHAESTDSAPTAPAAQPVRREPSLDEVPNQQTTPTANASLQPEPRPGLAEQARNLVMGKKPDAPKRREPQMRGSKVREDQMRIDFDDEPKLETPAPQAPKETKDSNKAVGQEVLVLNIKSPDNKPISGAALLPALLTLGFKFGDQDIFHRHVNSNGKGPVLFSLANMFKPGVFDVDNLETFSTQGLSLFMILPIEGDPHQVFNMMHNAARKLADEFGAQVLDGRRAVLTKQSLQQYVEKIREFERKRMIRKA